MFLTEHPAGNDTGNSIVEHVAGVDDFEVAEATYRADIAAGQRRALTAQVTLRVPIIFWTTGEV
jgi:hypothetical protein